MREISVFLVAETSYNKSLFEIYEVPQLLKGMMGDAEEQDMSVSFEIARTQPVYFDELVEEKTIKEYILTAGRAIIQQMKMQDPKIKILNVDENIITKPVDWQKLDEYIDKLENAVEEGDHDNEIFLDGNNPLNGKTCCPYEVVTENLPNKIFIYCCLNYEEVTGAVPKHNKDYYTKLILENNLMQFEKGIEEYNYINRINIKDASRLLTQLDVDLYLGSNSNNN